MSGAGKVHRIAHITVFHPPRQATFSDRRISVQQGQQADEKRYDDNDLAGLDEQRPHRFTIRGKQRCNADRKTDKQTHIPRGINADTACANSVAPSFWKAELFKFEIVEIFRRYGIGNLIMNSAI